MEPPAPPGPSAAQTTPATAFPKLEILPKSSFASHHFLRPAKRINDGPDVAHFLTSEAYRDIGVFVLQLNHALVPRNKTPSSTTAPQISAAGRAAAAASTQFFPLNAPRRDPQAVLRLRELLDRVEGIIDEAPPDPGPRRFGNVSFRRWHEMLEARAEELLSEFLPEEVVQGFGQERGDEAGPLDELKAYFLGGFGSSQRLDYGTGHELSFLAFLGCLWKLGGFVEGEEDGERVNGEIERSIVLGVIEPYLKVIRRLILTYTLEPAGSHGVWGLDDHAFLPYVFGSAQLARPITDPEPTPLEGSAPGAPRPGDVVKADAVTRHREANMYFSAIGFINDVKKGPFWEHSPILFDVSGIKNGWGKINKGMIKMFNAEVLSKFPVVQHFTFGSLFSWDADPDAAAPITSVHMANQPVAAAATAAAAAKTSSGTGAGVGTAAPWAQATRMPGGPALSGGPGVPYSQGPWSGGGSAGPSMPRGGPPDTGPAPPTEFPKGVPGRASNQFTVTKAPWAKD
ncbi:hypothetical protein B0T25DRAFT_457489 [Lasiosphaeria hispida]|uniref:Serine/threonine-protein phosphatase 2A activator n=1 Tax=Lasiosphaeria hispida TaxID=260671 RepID=A0AAJ0HFN6_9PEZI|nr:hypothetical protein B0T25DRAFT_457489 [Lasiosphaeria hispida]